MAKTPVPRSVTGHAARGVVIGVRAVDHVEPVRRAYSLVLAPAVIAPLTRLLGTIHTAIRGCSTTGVGEPDVREGVGLGGAITGVLHHVGIAVAPPSLVVHRAPALRLGALLAAFYRADPAVHITADRRIKGESLQLAHVMRLAHPLGLAGLLTSSNRTDHLPILCKPFRI
jgi:hypothetical protein